MRIGELSGQTGVKVVTIRFYETQGLLPPPRRTASGQREYTPADVARLRFLRHAGELGFPLSGVRELLGLADAPGTDCDAVHAVAARHLEEVDSRIRRLQAMRRVLKRAVSACEARVVARCPVVETLSDHAYCGEEHALTSRR
ncbi:MAG: helix-turn-helix domain-containing protein [Pseudomonadales bacterium]|nr:helix-turn-helix domain-containing protein [Pseudomonadales bacterium]MCP5183763.1 helix-turn-helix domain-containing protein [Pseudomonadales bacterium]